MYIGIYVYRYKGINTYINNKKYHEAWRYI